jgi:hypothetical protein
VGQCSYILQSYRQLYAELEGKWLIQGSTAQPLPVAQVFLGAGPHVGSGGYQTARRYSGFIELRLVKDLFFSYTICFDVDLNLSAKIESDQN